MVDLRVLRRYKYTITLAVIFSLLAVFWVHTFIEWRTCKDNGGTFVTAFAGWECVDERSD